MINFSIDKEKAVSVTGHRILREDLDKEKLKNALLTLAIGGYNTFLVGMAIGFDTLCFNLLEEIRRIKEIKIIACIPCLDQAKRFSFSQKKEYERMLSVADQKIVISEEYTAWCMQKRNQFMVDNSSVLISYLRENKGGTLNTVNYAKKKNIKIIEV